MFKQTRIEVLNIVAHLFLCTLVVAGYVYLRSIGIDDETFKLSLVAAITYFFGTSGQAALTSTFTRTKQDANPPAPPAAPPVAPAPVAPPQDSNTNTHA